MTGPNAWSESRRWIEKAEHDFRAAEYFLTLQHRSPFDVVCYLAQQCAEKYLKALLTFREIPFPFVHALTVLRSLLPEADRALIDGIEVEFLNPYVVEGRYPGDWDPIERTEAEFAIAIAIEVRSAVNHLLPEDRR
jgi:HEPN domain-containing protein